MSSADNVHVEALDLRNYGTWSFRMKMLLLSKGLWTAVETGTGELKDKAFALIALNVRDHHIPTMMAAKGCPKTAWEALSAVFQAKTVSMQLQLRHDLTGLRKQPGEPLHKYLARARTIWTELTASGLTIQENEVALGVLAGLPREYDVGTQVIQTMRKTLTLDDILADLMPIEQLSERNSKGEKALAAHTHSNTTYTPSNNKFHNNKAGTTSGYHERQPSRQRASNPHAHRTCNHCGKKGHIKEECRKLKRELEAAGRGHAVALSACTNNSEPDPTNWIIDSGASRHIVCDANLLVNPKPLAQPISITFGNGAVTAAESEGTVDLTLHTGAKVTLSDVLYVPGASSNLLCGASNFARRNGPVRAQPLLHHQRQRTHPGV